MELRTLLTALLVLLLPLWMLAGFADWLCHRRQHIESTSGWRESLLHVLLYLLIVVPLVLALWLRADALIMAILAAGVLTHMAVSWWDTAYSQPRRHIAPVEQLVHSHLEMLPLFALAIVIVLHWDEVLHPVWTLEPRTPPLPRGWTLGVMVALGVGMLPILDELLRGLRAARRLSEPRRAAPPVLPS